MELILKRIARKEDYTIGHLMVDGKFFADTLEDTDRGLTQKMSLSTLLQKKIHSKTAIPTGRYQIVWTYSNHFGKSMPLLMNVPGYAGVRIHSGNSAKDTEGCILVGTWDGEKEDWISDSRIAFEKLMSLLQKAEDKKESITITINNSWK